MSLVGGSRMAPGPHSGLGFPLLLLLGAGGQLAWQLHRCGSQCAHCSGVYPEAISDTSQEFTSAHTHPDYQSHPQRKEPRTFKSRAPGAHGVSFLGVSGGLGT